MSISKSKEQILSRIREANSIPREHKIPMPDFESPIYNNPIEDASVYFAQNFTNAAGKLVYCTSEDDMLSKLNAFLEKENLKNIYVWEQELSNKLDRFNIKHRTSTVDFVEAVEVGITFCEYLVARTGSILISTKKGGGRMLNIYPPTHIVVANLSQLVFDIKEGLNNIQDKYEEGNKPSMISLVTGPSRTADIEKTLVMGAHGPKELILFLVDDL